MSQEITERTMTSLEEWRAKKFAHWMQGVDYELGKRTQGDLCTSSCTAVDYWDEFYTLGNSDIGAAVRIIRRYTDLARSTKLSAAQRTLLANMGNDNQLRVRFTLYDLNCYNFMFRIPQVQLRTLQAMERKGVLQEHEAGVFSVTAVGRMVYSLLE